MMLAPKPTAIDKACTFCDALAADTLELPGGLFPLCRPHLKEARDHCADMPLNLLRFLPRMIYSSRKNALMDTRLHFCVAKE